MEINNLKKGHSHLCFVTPLKFIEDKILIEKWSPEEVSGYIKVNDIKFDIQPSFQLIYYWIEKRKLNIKQTDLVHKAKLEKKEKVEKSEKLPKHK